MDGLKQAIDTLYNKRTAVMDKIEDLALNNGSASDVWAQVKKYRAITKDIRTLEKMDV